MKKSEFFNLGLPKWPALLVVGKPVSMEQAMEIIIRTDHMGFSSNDREFDAQLNECLYDIVIPSPGYGSDDKAIRAKLGLLDNDWDGVYKYKNKKEEEVGKINLEYLHNSRVVSSWIGGPHGWCNWDGNIGSWNYNIGKWPSIEEVYHEWTHIAKAFPFLELTSQLLSGETGQDDSVPVVEFRVKNGKVRMIKPIKSIATHSFGNGSDNMLANLLRPGGERGCYIGQFKRAVEHVRSKLAVVAD